MRLFICNIELFIFFLDIILSLSICSYCLFDVSSSIQYQSHLNLWKIVWLECSFWEVAGNNFLVWYGIRWGKYLLSSINLKWWKKQQYELDFGHWLSIKRDLPFATNLLVYESLLLIWPTFKSISKTPYPWFDLVV